MSLLDAYTQRVSSGALKPDPLQESAAETLQELHDALIKKAGKKNWLGKAPKRRKSKKDSGPQGIYMYGGPGRGKSMLMDLFFASLPEKLPKRRVHFHEFMIEVHDYFHARRADDDFGDGIDGALPALACLLSDQAHVLCFDEFHVTDVADAMILGRLFTALFDRGVVVVATSNWPPDKLYEGGLQRDRFVPFIELLKERLKIVHLDGAVDYRSAAQVEEGHYFWPLGRSADEKIAAIFKRLTDGKKPKKEKLTVKGRTIHVQAAVKGAARFSFAALCEQPHGAEDYIKIAQTYPVIFLEHIPKLTYDRRNEAKRLMTLIDALYENKNQLFISADAPPDKLYRGHDHGFEFERTISRLLEMQSAGYKKT